MNGYLNAISILKNTEITRHNLAQRKKTKSRINIPFKYILYDLYHFLSKTPNPELLLKKKLIRNYPLKISISHIPKVQVSKNQRRILN
jgi:hypothetical protein